MRHSPTKLMSAALKREFLPKIKELGFYGRFSDFKRHAHESIEFLSIQYDKSGSSFILEIGVHPVGDFVAPWGDLVKEEDVSIDYVDLACRARVTYPSGRWFSFGRLGDESSPYNDLAEKTSHLLSQVEAWFNNGECGRNVHSMASNKSFNSDAGKAGAS